MSVHESSNEDVLATVDWENAVLDSVVEMRVSATTPVDGLAKSILGKLEDGKRVILSCIGSSSVHQGMKAISHANGEISKQGFLLIALPTFELREVKDKETGEPTDMTLMRLVVGKMPVII